MRGGVCVAPSAGVRRCPVWLWRRPPRTPAAVSSLLSVACRPPPAASSHERARPRCSLLSSRLVLSAATVHSMESPAASPPASLPQTKGTPALPRGPSHTQFEPVRDTGLSSESGMGTGTPAQG